MLDSEGHKPGVLATSESWLRIGTECLVLDDRISNDPAPVSVWVSEAPSSRVEKQNVIWTQSPCVPGAVLSERRALLPDDPGKRRPIRDRQKERCRHSGSIAAAHGRADRPYAVAAAEFEESAAAWNPSAMGDSKAIADLRSGLGAVD
jgi:hypothetical protein